MKKIMIVVVVVVVLNFCKCIKGFWSHDYLIITTQTQREREREINVYLIIDCVNLDYYRHGSLGPAVYDIRQKLNTFLNYAVL